ncbi:hypothetical protein D3C84_1005480 [compost metagenome]
MHALDDGAQSALDLQGSGRCGLQERDSARQGRDHLMQQVGNHGAPSAALEARKALNHLVIVRLKGDLNAWLDGWHKYSRWTLWA